MVRYPEEDRTSIGNLESMRVMMEMGADPRADNGTALHQAAFFGQTTAVELLLDAGVPVDCSGQPAVEEDQDDPYDFTGTHSLLPGGNTRIVRQDAPKAQAPAPLPVAAAKAGGVVKLALDDTMDF